MAEIPTVTIPGIDAPTTALGFGCSALLGDKTPEEGRRLLDAAYDAGIRHFDVARYYGYGDAERLVGAMASGKRDRVTITTKFGMTPMKNIAAARGLVAFVRRAMRASTFIRKIVRRNVSRVVATQRFDVPGARSSLETSLRELQTDYIDVYLLHEAEAADCRSEELLAFLTEARDVGKIRAFGVGSAFCRIPDILAAAPAFAQALQFESSFLARNVLQVDRQDSRTRGRERALFTHGAVGATAAIRDWIAANPGRRVEIHDRIGIDPTNTDLLAALALRQVTADNPGGVALFRASRPERIAATIQAFAENSFSPVQLDGLVELGQSINGAT